MLVHIIQYDIIGVSYYVSTSFGPMPYVLRGFLLHNSIFIALLVLKLYKPQFTILRTSLNKNVQ